jgi:hypothetical protein
MINTAQNSQETPLKSGFVGWGEVLEVFFMIVVLKSVSCDKRL